MAGKLGLALRLRQRADQWPLVDTRWIESVQKNQKLPTPNEQADILLLAIANKVGKDYGRVINLGEEEVTGHIGSLSLATTRRIKDYLAEQRWIDQTTERTHFRLTVSGWTRIGELHSGRIGNRQAFMAMQYGNDELDDIYTRIFKEAVKKTGFELKRLDDNPKSGLIDDRLRVEIAKSRFLVADLTHHNNGAYWEAGLAEGLGKPVIYTCEKSVFNGIAADGKRTHFDTNHHLTVIWERENLEEAGEALKATIRATLPAEADMQDV